MDSYKMKIALVQLKSPDGNYAPNLGILYIASLLLRNGYRVKVFDETLDERYFEKLVRFEPDMVGFTAVTVLINNVLKVSAKLKEIRPETIIVCGGPHPTAMPEEVVLNDVVDYVIMKEGEYPFLELVKAIEKESDIGRIENLYYKKNGMVMRNEIREYLTGNELDMLPYPAFGLLDLDKVFRRMRHGLFSRGKRILPIMTSRGCPHSCIFCCQALGHKFRRRSLLSVMAEIEYMIKEYGVDEIYFEDDSISEDMEWAKDILKSLIRLRGSGLRLWIKFANGMRADLVDEEILRLYKEAGGYYVGFGIESGSERVLKLMNKRLDLRKVEEAVGMAKRMELKVGGNLILGCPGETGDDINESIQFFKGLRLDSSAIVNMMPFPRTGARALAEKNGWLTEKAKNWDNYYFGILKIKPMMSTPYLSGFWLRYYILKAYMVLYMDILVRKIRRKN